MFSQDDDNGQIDNVAPEVAGWDWSSTKAPSQPLALLVDESPDVSNMFIAQGYVPVRYSHWGINTGQTNTIGAQLKSYRFSIVWVSFPKLTNKDRKYAHMTCLLNWARSCKELGIPFVLFGSYGKKWEDPQLFASTSDGTLQKRHHRLCHFGLHVEPGTAKPSSICFDIACSSEYYVF